MQARNAKPLSVLRQYLQGTHLLYKIYSEPNSITRCESCLTRTKVRNTKGDITMEWLMVALLGVGLAALLISMACMAEIIK